MTGAELGLGGFLSLQAAPARAESCTSVSLPDIAFGSFSPDAFPVDTTGTISISCNGMHLNATYEFCISIAIGSGFTGTTRQLVNGAQRLDFDLYKDAARTQRWGSYETGFAGGGMFLTKSTGGNPTLNFTVPVYARIFANQTGAPQGSYASSFSGQPFVRWDEAPPESSGCLSSSKTLSTSFSATATVAGSCTISGATLNFGSTSTLAANVDATAVIQVTCGSGMGYNVGLGVGNGAGATTAARKMTRSGGATITYSLYSDAARTALWGDTVPTNTVGGTGTGSAQNLTVYGRVPAQATPAPRGVFRFRGRDRHILSGDRTDHPCGSSDATAGGRRDKPVPRLRASGDTLAEMPHPRDTD